MRPADARTFPQRLGQPSSGPSTASTGRPVIIGFDQQKMGRNDRTPNPAEQAIAAGSVCGSLRATKSRLTPARDCENDVGGRFTKRPRRKSQDRFHLSSVFSSISAFLAGPLTPALKSHGRTGATPCLECPVRAWAGVGFHTHTRPFRGSLPSLIHPWREGPRALPRVRRLNGWL